MLVNRTTLVNSLIPNSCAGESDFSVQNAFLRIFISYLPRALKIAKEAYSWVIILIFYNVYVTFWPQILKNIF